MTPQQPPKLTASEPSSDWLNRIAPVTRPDIDGYSHTGHKPAGVNYLMPRRIIYDHELILYQGGHFLIETEDKQIHLEPDSFVILPPGVLHSELGIGDSTGYRYWCHFDWTWQPGYDTAPVMTVMPGTPSFHLCRPAPDYVPKGVLHGKIHHPEQAYRWALELVNLVSQGRFPARLQARGILLQLLATLLEHEPFTVGDQSRSNLPSEIRKRLDAGFSKPGMPLDLHAQLQDLGYSYEHMSRGFRRAYGVSPMQYVRALQISRAQFLLRNTDLPIAQIGYRTGFDSPAYFSKIFRQTVGLTPTVFRNA